MALRSNARSIPATRAPGPVAVDHDDGCWAVDDDDTDVLLASPLGDEGDPLGREQRGAELAERIRTAVELVGVRASRSAAITRRRWSAPRRPTL
jgi:hypothetical protein